MEEINDIRDTINTDAITSDLTFYVDFLKDIIHEYITYGNIIFFLACVGILFGTWFFFVNFSKAFPKKDKEFRKF